MKLKLNKFLLVVFLISLAIRMGYVLTLADEIKFDELDYDNLSWNIVSGKGYINTERDIFENHLAARPPAYPVFLAGVYYLFGHSVIAVRITQALISSFLVIFIYLIGKEVFNESTGKLAAVFGTIYPFFIYYSGVLQSELLCAFWLSLAVLFASRLLKKPGWKNIVLTGIFVGLTGLTRPVFILYGGFLLIGFIAFNKFSLLRALKLWLLVLTVVTIAFLPWVIRNYMVLDAFIPGTTEGGEALYVSAHPTADGSPGPNLYDQELVGIRQAIKDEVEQNRYLLMQTIGFVINDPLHYRWLIGKRFIKIWNIFPNTTLRDQVFSLFSFGILLPFFLVGFVRAIRQNQAIIPAVSIFYVSLVFPILFYGSTRLRFPIEPLILIFAASGMVALSSSFGYKMDRRMLELYRGKGIHTLFFRYHWWIYPNELVASFLPKEGLIYDLGSGHGILANYLVMQSPRRRVVGIDYNPERFKCAVSTVKNKNNPVFHLGDVSKKEYDQCEAFILDHLLHHCPSYQFQENIVKLCYKRLKPGGRLIIVEVDEHPRLKYALCWLLDHLLSPRHEIYYRNRKDMCKLLENIGFKVEARPIGERIPYSCVLYVAKKPG